MNMEQYSCFNNHTIKKPYQGHDRQIAWDCTPGDYPTALMGFFNLGSNRLFPLIETVLYLGHKLLLCLPATGNLMKTYHNGSCGVSVKYPAFSPKVINTGMSTCIN